MRNKPLYLKLFPFLAFGIALSFPIQIYYLYGISLNEMDKVISMLTPLNILTMGALMITSLLTLTLSKMIYKFLPALLFLIFANNAIVGLYGTDYTLIQVGLSFVLFGISLKPFYNTDIKAVINNPKLRWWNTPKRYYIEKPLELQTDALQFETMTSNISKTGIFASVSEEEMLNNFNIDEVIQVKIPGKEEFTLQAKVVRKADGENNQPLGFGLEFVQDQEHKTKYLPWLKDAVL